MSDQGELQNNSIIDFTSPNTPPPYRSMNDANGQETERKNSNTNHSVGRSSPPPIINTTVTNNILPKWSSQTVYLRVMGRKGGSNNSEQTLVKPFKATPMNYTIMGLFSKESNEVSTLYLY